MSVFIVTDIHNNLIKCSTVAGITNAMRKDTDSINLCPRLAYQLTIDSRRV